MYTTVQNGYFHFISNHIQPNVFAVGTLKLGMGSFGCGFKTFIAGDDFRYEEVYRQFICRLSKRVYGKANYRRYGKKIPNAGTLEGDSHMRYHLNLLLQRPDFISESEFNAMLSEEWSRLPWSLPDINIQPCSSPCIFYSIKDGVDRIFFE